MANNDIKTSIEFLKNTIATFGVQPEYLLPIINGALVIVAFIWLLNVRRILDLYCINCANEVVPSKDFKQVFAIHEVYGLDIIKKHAVKISEATGTNMNEWKNKSWFEAWTNLIKKIYVKGFSATFWEIFPGPPNQKFD